MPNDTPQPTSDARSGQPSPELVERLKKIRLLGLDSDGVLTDGGLYMGDQENVRRFDSRDGVGIKLLQEAGIQVAIISGKKCEAVYRRASELGIADVAQGTLKKVAAMNEIITRHSLKSEQVAFMGDDLPDLPMFREFGVGLAPANACAEVMAAADWVASVRGGDGAVREAAELILKAQDAWQPLLKKFDYA